jgi:hypothetical protein
VTVVDPVFAQWLQGKALFHLATDAILAARWGDRAQTTERITPLAAKADAEAEAARQLAFLGAPMVEDEHLLIGAWAAFIGQVIILESEQLGYFDGTLELGGATLTFAGMELTLGGGGEAVACFVVGARDDRAAGLSQVTVLRRL